MPFEFGKHRVFERAFKDSYPVTGVFVKFTGGTSVIPFVFVIRHAHVISAVHTDQFSRKQIYTAFGCRFCSTRNGAFADITRFTPAVPKLTGEIPCVPVNDGFMGVLHTNPLAFGRGDGVALFIGGMIGFALHQIPYVDLVFQNRADRGIFPQSYL